MLINFNYKESNANGSHKSFTKEDLMAMVDYLLATRPRVSSCESVRAWTGATRCQLCRKQIYFNIRGVNMYKQFKGTMSRCNRWIDKLKGLST